VHPAPVGVAHHRDRHRDSRNGVVHHLQKEGCELVWRMCTRVANVHACGECAAWSASASSSLCGGSHFVALFFPSC
jgi:hypothetical protein